MLVAYRKRFLRHQVPDRILFQVMKIQMKIGFIVDGQAEFRSLPSILSKIDTNEILVNPLYADLQPGANKLKLVRAALPSIRILARKGIDRILVLLDHERRATCIPTWRAELEDALADPCRNNGIVDVKVVLKAQMYENWLVSDLAAIRRMP